MSNDYTSVGLAAWIYDEECKVLYIHFSHCVLHLYSFYLQTCSPVLHIQLSVAWECVSHTHRLQASFSYSGWTQLCAQRNRSCEQMTSITHVIPTSPSEHSVCVEILFCPVCPSVLQQHTYFSATQASW